MCPYEVPKYSERRGIVRKCDMCHQRLAHGEAPACVQACPSEAIRITVVEQEAMRNNYRQNDHHQFGSSFGTTASANPFLPCSPEPAITLPTTRYVSERPLPAGLTAGDEHEARLQPTHAPLVWMLVLTQFGAGGFALLPLTPGTAQPALALMALAAALLGVVGSVLHLGRPQKAWRAFLGLRRSWLSREIVMFGIFALLAAATTIFVCPGLREPVLMLITALTGVLCVFCSGMTYHVTRRDCWRGELSIGRFFGTTAVLGIAGAWCATAFSGRDCAWFAVALAVATTAKLSRELALLRRCPDDADLNDELPIETVAQSAFLMRFRLGGILRSRLACAWLGGVTLPLLSLIPGPATFMMTIIGLLLCLAGEIAERVLFFRAATVARMPGSVAA
jgi:DMSO reductase anchor subunit